MAKIKDRKEELILQIINRRNARFITDELIDRDLVSYANAVPKSFQCQRGNGC